MLSGWVYIRRFPTMSCWLALSRAERSLFIFSIILCTELVITSCDLPLRVSASQKYHSPRRDGSSAADARWLIQRRSVMLLLIHNALRCTDTKLSDTLAKKSSWARSCCSIASGTSCLPRRHSFHFPQTCRNLLKDSRTIKREQRMDYSVCYSQMRAYAHIQWA